MTRGLGKNKDENVFAQILASLVALGYQVKQFLVDAWSHGSPQQRSRIFIVASAPGCTPWELPALTHDHQSDKEFRGTALGKATNGLRYGLRRNDVTPFRHVSPREITVDLPDVGDSTPQICVRFPDHRTPIVESFASRERIARIPTRPQGMGIEQAVREKAITSGEALEFLGRSSGIRRNANSRSYSRVYPGGLFGTMLTALHIACGKNGRSLHWEQPRTLTVMEARRAQGFLDHEVIVGTPAQQMKIIGNSVDRKAAFVLGLALREAWLARWDGDEDGREIDGHPIPTVDEAKLASQALRSIPPDALQVVSSAVNARQHVENCLVEKVAKSRLDAIEQMLHDELAQDDVEGRYSITSPATRTTSHSARSKRAGAISHSRSEVFELLDSSSSETDAPRERAAKLAKLTKEIHGPLTPAKDSSSKEDGSGLDVEVKFLRRRAKVSVVGPRP